MSKANNALAFALRFRYGRGDKPPFIRVTSPVVRNRVVLCVSTKPEKHSNQGERVMHFHARNVAGAAAYIVGNKISGGGWHRAELFNESTGEVIADWDRGQMTDDIGHVTSILKSMDAVESWGESDHVEGKGGLDGHDDDKSLS